MDPVSKKGVIYFFRILVPRNKFSPNDFFSSFKGNNRPEGWGPQEIPLGCSYRVLLVVINEAYMQQLAVLINSYQSKSPFIPP